jgi:hypothetical protein
VGPQGVTEEKHRNHFVAGLQGVVVVVVVVIEE